MNRIKLIEKGRPKAILLEGLLPFRIEGLEMIKGGDSCGRLTTCSIESKKNKCFNTYIVHCANVNHICESRYIWQGGTEPIF